MKSSSSSEPPADDPIRGSSSFLARSGTCFPKIPGFDDLAEPSDCRGLVVALPLLHLRAMTSAAPLNDSFRQAMRRVASTVNVISLWVDGQPFGITATAVSSISLEPPSLLVCINRTAFVHAKMEDATHFGVNVLHRDQQPVACMFADRAQHGLRFVSGWENDGVAPPRLIEAQAAMRCRRIDSHAFGTHSIFIGQVEDVVVRDDVHPLLYLNGRYLSVAD